MTNTQIQRIDWLERMNCSVNGNPKYRVHFADGTSAVTSSDAGFCYAINNKEYRDADLEVTYTAAGRIANIHPVSAK